MCSFLGEKEMGGDVGEVGCCNGVADNLASVVGTPLQTAFKVGLLGEAVADASQEGVG
jgi:hypothetical protein